VVAVVNNQAILASDIDDEIRLSVLDPGRGGLGVLTRARPRPVDRPRPHSAADSPGRPAGFRTGAGRGRRAPAEIRKELPACVRQNCASDEGWKAFLRSRPDLRSVETYLRYRLEILRFIEQRFRQGISISASGN
jgi:peptidyl-prolyl cis-trans isomerase SurA